MDSIKSSIFYHYWNSIPYFSNKKHAKPEHLKVNTANSHTYCWVILHKNWGMKVLWLLHFAICHEQILVSVDLKNIKLLNKTWTHIKEISCIKVGLGFFYSRYSDINYYQPQLSSSSEATHIFLSRTWHWNIHKYTTLKSPIQMQELKPNKLWAKCEALFCNKETNSYVKNWIKIPFSQKNFSGFFPNTQDKSSRENKSLFYRFPFFLHSNK